MPCRINVFSGRKREKSPRENPPKGNLVGFSHGDLSPRQAKIRQTVAESATHGMSRTFVWRGERSPCENTKMSPFGGFSRGDLSRFRPCLSYLCLAGRKVATRKHAKWWFWRVFAWRPFAPPGKDTTNRRLKGDAWKVSYFHVAGRKVAMRKHEIVIILRVFALRLFAPKTRQYDMAQISHHSKGVGCRLSSKVSSTGNKRNVL